MSFFLIHVTGTFVIYITQNKMQNKKMTIQLAMAVFLTVSGMAMLIMGLWTPPVGEIHSSVLIAYGEVSTFAGSLFGIDYTYRYKLKKTLNNDGQNNA